MTRRAVSPFYIPFEIRAQQALVACHPCGSHTMAPYGKRWCEHGQHYAPRTGKAVKGWKCSECRHSPNAAT